MKSTAGCLTAAGDKQKLFWLKMGEKINIV
jgi:hypothetical protein